MDRWTEAEFLRAAQETRIQKRTLDACKDVLVNGVSGADAARNHQMFQAQISRAITTLREAQARSGQLQQVVIDRPEVAKMMALEIAKGVLGPATALVTAEPGKSYSGKVAVSTVGWIVQKVGRTGVLHEKSAFDVVPEQGANVEIAYLEGRAVKARVTEVSAPGVEKNDGPER